MRLAEPLLREGYRRCARLTWRYGTTYFWGAALLPKPRRRHVHAVYALCRLADDIVDDQELVGASTPAETAARLQAFADDFRAALVTRSSPGPVIAAVVDTVISCAIDPECFDRFFTAMAMDLTTSTYETFADLCGYMEGSAAVIGEMMLPVLEPAGPQAREPARALGLAFQLTNFLRDVGEDLDRGRVYLPQADLRRFGVDLQAERTRPPGVPGGRPPRSDEWKAFLAYEITRNRELYALADEGIAMLPPRSARCVGAARVLYSRILERIEHNDYDVFSSRARVPTWHKAITAARIMVAGPDTRRSRPHVIADAG